MKISRRHALALPLAVISRQAFADDSGRARAVLQRWYHLVLELVRHTATYSPPVASRAFACLGIAAFEAVASTDPSLTSLAGQLPGLTALPAPTGICDVAVTLNAALSAAVEDYFSNTGPTGHRAMAAVAAKLASLAAQDVREDVAQRSMELGPRIAGHIFKWSQGDGAATIANLGFPDHYDLKPGPAHWQPTNHISLQQAPLLPGWGGNRGFAIQGNAPCPLPPPPAYSEDKSSEFYRQALEVYTLSKSLTPEQKAIARFWSDDPMLSPTPPGHWISIALQLFETHHTPLVTQVSVLARLGMAIADAFIVCWRVKFDVDLLRPVTYIKRVIDPNWEPLLITPPFPEYPSGHSTQSGAAAGVLEKSFGKDVAFDDATAIKDGIKPRRFANFDEAAKEAAVSRIYGGIHFRAAADQGLLQGRCVAQFVNALAMEK
jgi:hypothetical protein